MLDRSTDITKGRLRVSDLFLIRFDRAVEFEMYRKTMGRLSILLYVRHGQVIIDLDRTSINQLIMDF